MTLEQAENMDYVMENLKITFEEYDASCNISTADFRQRMSLVPDHSDDEFNQRIRPHYCGGEK